MKTVFITGTSSGLGKAAVRLFHAEGWKVIATMRNVEKGNAFAGMENVTVLPLDVANTEQIKSTVAAALALGPVDVVVNNAAYGAIGPLESVSDQQLLQLLDTNLLGPIRITQAFIPHFRNQRSGIFINVTSSAGLVTFPFASLYHATKFGVEGWSEGMSYELAPFGIQIKNVAPGHIKTDFGSNATVTFSEAYKPYQDHFLGVMAAGVGLEAGSSPEEVAAVVYEAVTDGKDQVHYLAGKDVTAQYNQRLQSGPELWRGAMTKLFLP